jgi:hypothetical protein
VRHVLIRRDARYVALRQAGLAGVGTLPRIVSWLPSKPAKQSATRRATAPARLARDDGAEVRAGVESVLIELFRARFWLPRVAAAWRVESPSSV